MSVKVGRLGYSLWDHGQDRMVHGVEFTDTSLHKVIIGHGLAMSNSKSNGGMHGMGTAGVDNLQQYSRPVNVCVLT